MMITKEQYKALRRYLNGDVPVDEKGLSEIDQYLLEQKYIESAEMGTSVYSGVFQLFTAAYRITELGHAALAEYGQKRRERIFQIRLAALSAALGAALTLLVEALILFLR